MKDSKTQTVNETGQVFGCMMPKGAVPVEGDFSSLKQAAEHRIARGDLVGLNPHKVLKLCREFEELKKKADFTQKMRRRVITTLSWMVADMKHRFDDCRNNFEVPGDDGAAVLAAGGYSAELSEAIELLDELKKGVQAPDESLIQAAFREGFDHAKDIILKEIDKMRW